MRNGLPVTTITLITLAFGCAELSSERHQQPTETDEIIDNLIQAGFPAEDIMVVAGVVYVGRDVEVSLAASREMIQTEDTHKEQYHSANLVSKSLKKICVNGSTFTGVFSAALDLAIQNYNEQQLTFTMARTPSLGCNFTINGVIQPGTVGGVSGPPSGGLPFGTINIGGGLSTFNVNTVAHVITHELGHTIGLRHSDYFNRSISCGGTAVNEESPSSGIGAILVSGTPSGATVGGSIMNSCFRQVEAGEFTATDVVALKALYRLRTSDIVVQQPNNGLVTLWLMSDGTIVDRKPLFSPGAQVVGTGDFNHDGTTDILLQQPNNGMVAVWLMSNGQVVDHPDLANPQARVVGTGDFNGDGTTDILFQHANNGLVAVWLMSDGRFADPHDLVNPGAKVVGTGDFNGDGTTDILFQHDNDGLVAVWLMSDGVFADPHDLVGPGAKVVGTGDFNGDGTTDILFQHDNDGLVAVWLMSDGIFADPHDLVGPGAKVVGTGDFNGDGTTDILYQHTDTGLVAEWLMSDGIFAQPRDLEISSAQVVGTGNVDGR